MRDVRSGRACGTCAFCCEAPVIDEIEKPSQQMCTACVGGDQRCGVYDDRPEVCRDFQCAWLANPEIPDRARPDRCGAMFSVPTEELRDNGVFMMMTLDREGDHWKNSATTMVIRGIIGRGGVVIRVNKDGELLGRWYDDKNERAASVAMRLAKDQESLTRFKP